MIIEEAEIVLNFDGNKVSKGLKDTKKGITDLNQDASKFGKHISSTLGEIKNVTGEISKVGAALGLVVGTTDYIRQVAIATRATDNLSKSVGMGADEITANRLANERLGISMEATNTIMAERASIQARLNTGGDAVALLGQDFSARGGNVNVMRTGSYDEQIAEFKRIYDKTIATRKDFNKETQAQAESYASNLNITGWQELLPILRMTNDEYRNLVNTQKERSGITDENTEEAKKLAAEWSAVSSNISLLGQKTARTLTPATTGFAKYLNYATKDSKTLGDEMFKLNPVLGVMVKTMNLGGEAIDYMNNGWAKMSAYIRDIAGFSPLGKLGENINNALPESVSNGIGSGIAHILAAGGNEEAGNAIKINATTDEQKENMRMVYEAYKKQGLSHNQAATMTSEVGRENDFNSKFMFGTHTDKAGGQNIGMISMQGDRNPALQEYMKNRGLMKGGKMEHSQAAIDAQAAFQVAEMKSGKYPKAEEFLSKPDIGRNEGSELMGTGYVKWAKHQTRLRNGESFNPAPHLAKEYGYYDAVNKMQQQPPSIDTKALANPQAQSAQGATTTNNVTINLPTTDPAQAGNVIESQLKNVSKNAPYRSGMNPS